MTTHAPHRGETRALIGGGGGEYSYFLVLPDEFLLKSAVIKVNFKRNSSGRTRIYEYSCPPPPINALVSPLAPHEILAPKDLSETEIYDFCKQRIH